MADSPCPQSPWKRPKVVSLTKTKSIKRRSEIFAAHNANNDSFGNSPSVPRMLESSIVEEDGFAPKAPKERKTVLNRFSVKSKFNFNGNSNENSFNSSMNLNESGNLSVAEKNNDLSSFFSGAKESGSCLSYEERAAAEKKLEPAVKPKADAATSFCPSVISNLKSSLIFSESSPLSAAPKPPLEEAETFSYEHDELVPVDWSLKTRCRFLSTKPFSCNTGIKSSHESEAMTNYANFRSFYTNLESCKLNSTEQNKNLYKTLLCESVSYWTFPYLPWINLYPRNSSFGNLSTMLEPLHVEIQKSLSKSWNQSFKSLYNSLKSNECPYFYVLTHSFIVMFKAENIGTSSGEMHAILTPSTKGLRQSLADIAFTMPLSTRDINSQANTSDLASSSMEQGDKSNILLSERTESNSNSNSNNEENDSGIKNVKTDSNSNSNENEEDDEEMDEVNDEPDEWLEKMGLDSAVNFKASVLQRNSKDQKKNQFLNFDNRPRSTLLFMQGSEVQALFNFLLNSKSCVASSGPLTGIPPTLIAPTTFVGATLQKNRIEQNIIKSLNSEGDPITQYALDFIGPIMPYHVHRLCNLFRQTNGQFDMVASTYESSAALNCVKSSGEGGGDEHQGQQTANKPTKLLDKSELSSLESSHGIFGESNALRTVSYKNGRFCCNC